MRTWHAKRASESWCGIGLGVFYSKLDGEGFLFLAKKEKNPIIRAYLFPPKLVSCLCKAVRETRHKTWVWSQLPTLGTSLKRDIKLAETYTPRFEMVSKESSSC